MTNNNSIIIFHRTKQPSEEDIAHKQALLEANKEIIGSTRIIDYVSGDYLLTKEIFEFPGKNRKYTVILTSFLSNWEHDSLYDLNLHFRTFKAMGEASIYLMDSSGKLYKEVETIEML